MQYMLNIDVHLKTFVKMLFFRLSVSLKKRLISAYNLDSVAAIQWGVQHERTALSKYREMGAEIEETGLC